MNPQFDSKLHCSPKISVSVVSVICVRVVFRSVTVFCRAFVGGDVIGAQRV